MSNTVLVLREFYKHPNARIDIDFRLMSSDGDKISSVGSVDILPNDSLATDGIDIDAITGFAKVWFKLGLDEADYTVTVPIHTDKLRDERPQIIIKVRA